MVFGDTGESTRRLADQARIATHFRQSKGEHTEAQLRHRLTARRISTREMRAMQGAELCGVGELLEGVVPSPQGLALFAALGNECRGQQQRGRQRHSNVPAHSLTRNG
jgi:hypothetical protein